MERSQRDFKGVWIPREIWLSEQLTLMEKVLFVEIHSLDNERGCYASNRYFAQFFDLSERQLRRHLVSLKNKGLITMTMKSATERIIRVRGKHARATEAEMHAIKGMRLDLIRKFSVQKLSPGMSTEGGRKRPGRGDIYFRKGGTKASTE